MYTVYYLLHQKLLVHTGDKNTYLLQPDIIYMTIPDIINVRRYRIWMADVDKIFVLFVFCCVVVLLRGRGRGRWRRRRGWWLMITRGVGCTYMKAKGNLACFCLDGVHYHFSRHLSSAVAFFSLFFQLSIHRLHSNHLYCTVSSYKPALSVRLFGAPPLLPWRCSSAGTWTPPRTSFVAVHVINLIICGRQRPPWMV